MKIEQVAFERGYRVSIEGKLFNKRGDEIGYDDGGYMKTCLRVNKKLIKLKVHRLQAFQKYGNALYKKGIVVRHKNGVGLDNSWENILIGTQSENRFDVPKQIRVSSAITATSFVKKHDHEAIRLFYNKSRSYQKTLKEFNISSKGTLHFILKGIKNGV